MRFDEGGDEHAFLITLFALLVLFIYYAFFTRFGN